MQSAILGSVVGQPKREKRNGMATRKFVVLDTETAGGFSSPKVYDIGYVVADNNGVICESRNWLVKEIFTNRKIMNTAYYAEKVPAYIAAGIPVEKFAHIRSQLLEDIERYDIRTVWAYNAKFDRNALNSTTKWLSHELMDEFLPGMQWRDIWTCAGAILCDTVKYCRFCKENGYLTDSGYPKTSAEIVTRFILEDDSFIEDHTALSDSLVELAILLETKSKKKKMPDTLGQGYKYARRSWAKVNG